MSLIFKIISSRIYILESIINVCSCYFIEKCVDWDVRLNKDFTPWIYWNSEWHPICANKFCSNDNQYGAVSFCKQLGYESGECHWENVKYTKDALQIGPCNADEQIKDCGDRGHALTNDCKKDNDVKITITCSGNGGAESTCGANKTTSLTSMF